MKKRVFINKLKNNKVKIAVFSGLMATAIGLSTGLGIYATSKSVEQTEYLYQKGVVKFDSNGKLLIPKVVDPNNPSGIYEHMPEPIDNIEVDEELINDPEIHAEVDKDVNKALNEYKTIFKDVLDKEVIISNEMKLLFNNLLPSMQIEQGDVTSFGHLLEDIFEVSKLEAYTKEPDNQYASDLCALNGINFNQFYNELNSIPTVELYGGPGIPDPNHFDDNINPGELNESFGDLDEREKLVALLVQDYKTRFKLAVSFTTIFTALTVISIILTAISFFTAGFSTMALIQLSIDITSSVYTMTMSWLEYKSTFYALSELNKIIDIISNSDVMTDEESASYGLSLTALVIDAISIRILIDKNIKLKNNPELKNKSIGFNKSFEASKLKTNIHINRLSMINSAFSIIASITLIVLQNVLINYKVPVTKGNK